MGFLLSDDFEKFLSCAYMLNSVIGKTYYILSAFVSDVRSFSVHLFLFCNEHLELFYTTYLYLLKTQIVLDFEQGDNKVIHFSNLTSRFVFSVYCYLSKDYLLSNYPPGS